MIETRRLALDVRYNSYPFAGQVGGDIESLTYTDSAADNSDSIDITINAQDRKWLLGWMPEKGATLRARVLGYNWERQGQRSIMECGLFVLDDVSFSDAPTTLQVGGVSKPSDSDFSELERDVIWKNTSIKRIGAKIAARYGLAFTYDADDYDIECDEQDGTDSSYYNSLCKNYGLILKVYARRLWVYDREKYKAKRAVRTFDRSQIRPGSFGYTTTLSGTYTGGYFNYTDADKDIDIECSVGGGSHTKSVNRRATSAFSSSADRRLGAGRRTRLMPSRCTTRLPLYTLHSETSTLVMAFAVTNTASSMPNSSPGFTSKSRYSNRSSHRITPSTPLHLKWISSAVRVTREMFLKVRQTAWSPLTSPLSSSTQTNCTGLPGV